MVGVPLTSQFVLAAATMAGGILLAILLVVLMMGMLPKGRGQVVAQAKAILFTVSVGLTESSGDEMRPKPF